MPKNTRESACPMHKAQSRRTGSPASRPEVALLRREGGKRWLQVDVVLEPKAFVSEFVTPVPSRLT